MHTQGKHSQKVYLINERKLSTEMQYHNHIRNLAMQDNLLFYECCGILTIHSGGGQNKFKWWGWSDKGESEPPSKWKRHMPWPEGRNVSSTMMTQFPSAIDKSEAEAENEHPFPRNKTLSSKLVNLTHFFSFSSSLNTSSLKPKMS